jgi:HAMP domain-containing protein
VLFLLIALAAALLIGRTGNEVDVPQEVLNYQETATQSAAQSVRRSANEGANDLQALSSALTPFLSTDEAQSTELTEALRAIAQLQNRYLQLYVIDEQGEVLANAAAEGDEPSYDPLEIVDPFEEGGMSYAWQSEEAPVPVILQYAPLPEQDGQSRAVIGWYDPAFFRFPLSAAGPGEVWLVNDQGQVIGARQGFTAFQELPRQPLRDAAAQGAAGESGTIVASDSPDNREIISFAPVAGGGPSGSLGWSVVTTRSVDSVSLPETNARRQGFVIAVVIWLSIIVVFGWLYIQVLRPLFRLQREAERLAYGDLSRGVEVVRYDEIGLIARALERIRVLLVRRRVQGERPLRNGETTEKED